MTKLNSHRWARFLSITKSIVLAACLLMEIPSASFGGDAKSFADLISSRDPLSCAIEGTRAKLCDGAAGAWQLGRLALSVEATAKALELAGMGFESNTIQQMIYRDGARSGFDLTLVAPTISLLAEASTNAGAFGGKSGEISSLATISLEALYPGAAAELGLGRIEDLPGAKRTDGFSSFPEYAREVSAGNPRALSFEVFMPVRLDTLSGSQPLLKLIPGVTNSSQGNNLGPSPNDFVFTSIADRKVPIVSSSSPLGGFPVSLAFTESLKGSVDGAGRKAADPGMDSLAKTGGCVLCEKAKGGGEIKFLEQLTVPGEGSGRTDAEPSFGGEFLDTFSIRDKDNDARAPAADSALQTKANCLATCPREAVPGLGKTVVGGTGIVVGAAAVYGGSVTKNPRLVVGGVTAMVGGAYAMVDGFNSSVKGVTACVNKCDPKDNKDLQAKEEQPADKDKADKADKAKADKEKADKEKADKDKADKEKADKNKADKNKADKDKADKDKADADKPDNGGNGASAKTQLPPEARDDNQPDDTQKKQGGNCRKAIEVNGVKFCKDQIFESGTQACIADSSAEVRCLGSNVIVGSVMSDGPLFVSQTNGDREKLIKLSGSHQEMLFGDVVQASILANVDPEHFNISLFEPIHDGQGTVVRSAAELLRAQSTSFTASGFGAGLAGNPNGGIGHKLPDWTVSIVNGNVVLAPPQSP
ncbi:hypothetical protein NKI19_02365 [Mesorhizobium sp. M0751]|uniref:hypothetical protein n=1 Tax=unclassified Mesorhizobium TaxID=325217 RepID=UPI0033374F85